MSVFIGVFYKTSGAATAKSEFIAWTVKRLIDTLSPMQNTPLCPKCSSENTYFDGTLNVCPDCGNEWLSSETAASESAATDNTIKDANGNVLADGDAVSVIKDLKVKGSSSVVKVGTKVKNIRLVPDADDGHNIDCKIEGFGAMKLKSEFVKKLS